MGEVGEKESTQRVNKSQLCQHPVCYTADSSVIRVDEKSAETKKEKK